MSIVTAALATTAQHEQALLKMEDAMRGLPVSEAAGLLCACMVICLEMMDIDPAELEDAAVQLARDTVFANRTIPGVVQ